MKIVFMKLAIPVKTCSYSEICCLWPGGVGCLEVSVARCCPWLGRYLLLGSVHCL